MTNPRLRPVISSSLRITLGVTATSKSSELAVANARMNEQNVSEVEIVRMLRRAGKVEIFQGERKSNPLASLQLLHYMPH
jgi:hypothetical protein